MPEPDRVKVHRHLAERHRRAWLVGAVLAGLLVLVSGLVLIPDGDALSTILVVLGAVAVALGVLGVSGQFAAREPVRSDAIPAPSDGIAARSVIVPVEGDHDTITVNVFHLLRASWATTVDLTDGSSLVAGADGDMLEVRDCATGRITWARVDGSGSVTVASEAEVPIIVGALRALAHQLMGAGLAYEPSVTVRAGAPSAIPVGSVGPRSAP